MSTALNERSVRLSDWLKHQAVPLWLEKGVNPTNGVHYERFFNQGEPDKLSPMRVRVQARQAFFFAAASSRGWCDRGAEVSHRMLKFVLDAGQHPSYRGGYVKSFKADYSIASETQDLYDHAFILLAHAWVFRVTNDNSLLVNVDRLVCYLDQKYGVLNGGWNEGDYDYFCRRQNPHMHLFEAFLALYDATGDAKWLARVGEIFSLFQTHFYSVDQQVVFEFFKQDWSSIEGVRGQVVEPGHLMEWVWLLDWYSKRSGRDVSYYTNILFKRGVELGLDSSGMLYDAVTPSGRVLDGNKRCWGITEYIKACLVQIRSGNTQAEVMAIKAVDDLFKHYLNAATPGLYIEHRGVNNEIIQDVAPATTLYHIIMAAMELDDHCKIADRTIDI